MQFPLQYSVQHLLILGAGASVDYNLPVWADLCPKMKNLLESEEGDLYTYKTEILSWISRVGQGSRYATIDECIAIESISKEYKANGGDIENQIFILMRDILQKSYTENEDGWINTLNRKFLTTSLESRIAFINYNYDDVLNQNFLNFDGLTQKEKRSIYKTRLAELSGVQIPTLCPHGTLFPNNEIDYNSHVFRYASTIKTGDDEYVDVVSCFDSGEHEVFKDNLVSKVNLYILGLGGGMEINLNKILLRNPVSKIHVTVRDKSLTENIFTYLSEQYKVPTSEIKEYSNCDELVAKCF